MATKITHSEAVASFSAPGEHLNSRSEASCAKRQLSKDYDAGITTIYIGSSNINTFQKLSHGTTARFLKVPVTIGGVPWKDLRLYCRFLDLKAQAPNLGNFKIYHTHRTYQRHIKKMIAKGWVWRESGEIRLRSYQAVWRMMGIEPIYLPQIHTTKFKYWKLFVDDFSEEPKKYLKEIEHAIRIRIAKRKAAQMRWALRKYAGIKNPTEGTFGVFGAARTFGYRSASSGSKLRKTYFEVLPPLPGEKKWRWDPKEGRYKELPKKIAL